MDLETLRIFVEVVRQQNITRASALLNVAQPAVTRRIQTVEEELGLSLLARHRRGVQPTEAGMILFERAELLLRLVDELPKEILSRASEPVGRLQFAFPPGLGNVFVFNMVAEFMRRHPRVDFSLHEVFSQQVREALIAGRIDIGIMSSETGHADLQSSPLYEEPLWVIGRASEWPFDTNAAIDAAQLVSRPLLIASSIRILLERLGQARGLRFDVRLEANAYMSVYEAVRRGAGLLVAPPSTVGTSLESGELVGAAIDGLQVSRVLYWRHDRPLSRAMMALIAAVEDEAAKLRSRNPALFKLLPSL